MNETVKKGSLIAVIVVAVVVAIFFGKSAIAGPALEKSKEMGHGTPGHGMKAQEKADEAGSPSPNAGKGDPLAGG